MWNQLSEEALLTKLNCNVFAGFNANVDVVIQLEAVIIEEIIKSEPNILADFPQNPTEISPVSTPNQFMALLKHCVGEGKSQYGVMDSKLGEWFDHVFPKRQEAMGGQGGIIANQMAALEARSHVYCPVLSAKQAGMFDPSVYYPRVVDGLEWIPIQTAVNNQWTKINYIFEYAKGTPFKFGDETVVAPRANRIILGTRNPKAAMGFDPLVGSVLKDLGESIDLAFLTGYHHGKIIGRAETLNEYLELSLTDLKRLKSGNPTLKLHLEYVPMQDSDDEIKTLETLAPLFTSFGINENEIRRLLAGLGHDNLVNDLVNDERAFALYQGSLEIARRFNIQRVQLHNLGYYVVVLMKPYDVKPELVRQACLFASAVNGVKAIQGGAVPLVDLAQMQDYPLSDIGIKQLEKFVTEANAAGLPVTDNMVDTGIMEMDDHWVLIIPAHVVPNPVSTVGMGDTISSSAYAAEVSLAKDG